MGNETYITRHSKLVSLTIFAMTVAIITLYNHVSTSCTWDPTMWSWIWVVFLIVLMLSPLFFYARMLCLPIRDGIPLRTALLVLVMWFGGVRPVAFMTLPVVGPGAVKFVSNSSVDWYHSAQSDPQAVILQYGARVKKSYGITVKSSVETARVALGMGVTGDMVFLSAMWSFFYILVTGAICLLSFE